MQVNNENFLNNNMLSRAFLAPSTWGVRQIKNLSDLKSNGFSIATKLALTIKAICGLAIAILGLIPALVGSAIALCWSFGHNKGQKKASKGSLQENNIDVPKSTQIVANEQKVINTNIPNPENIAPAEIEIQQRTVDETGLTPEMVGLIYYMCNAFNEVADQFGIKYIANGGTFIGAVRHEGFIRWDDDADLQLLLGEEEKLADKIPNTNEFKVKPEIEKALAARGLKLAGHWGGWKLCPINYPSFARAYYPEKPVERQFCWPFVDIFMSKKLDADRIDVNCASNTSLTADKVANWEREWFPNVKEPGGWMKFGPIRVPVAYSHLEDCEAYIGRAYNKEWKTQARIVYNHKKGERVSPPLEFRIIDYSPGEYNQHIFETGQE